MSVDTGILDQVTQQFMNALERDGNIIQQAGEHLFYYFCIIQLSITALWMVLTGESLQRLVSRMVQLAFSFGFFFGLIQLGGQWVPDLLNGFIEIGQQGGVQSLDPSSIINQGVSISGAIFHGFFNWGLLSHPFVSLIGAAVCIALLILYAFIAAELTVILIKAYAVISVGGLFFAFGASEYTRQMTQHYVSTAIGLGLQLMMLYLLLGVGQNIGSDWAQMTQQAANNHELMPMLVILAAVIVYYLIIKNVPTFIAGLSGVGGFKNYGDTAVGMAINAGFTGANALSNVKRAGTSSIQAGTQMGTGASQVFQSANNAIKQRGFNTQGIKHAGASVAKHVGSAAFNTVRDMATKTNSHLSTGQKFNQHLANKIKPTLTE